MSQALAARLEVMHAYVSRNTCCPDRIDSTYARTLACFHALSIAFALACPLGPPMHLPLPVPMPAPLHVPAQYTSALTGL